MRVLIAAHLSVEVDKNHYKTIYHISVPAAVTGIFICLLLLVVFLPRRTWGRPREVDILPNVPGSTKLRRSAKIEVRARSSRPVRHSLGAGAGNEAHSSRLSTPAIP